MRDSVHNISPVQALAPVVVAATATSDAVDLRGFDMATVIVCSGAIVGSGDYTAKLEHSAISDSGFTDVAAEDLIGTFPASLVAASLVKVGYIGKKRYIRAVVTKNSGTSIAANVIVERGRPRLAPTT